MRYGFLLLFSLLLYACGNGKILFGKKHRHTQTELNSPSESISDQKAILSHTTELPDQERVKYDPVPRVEAPSRNPQRIATDEVKTAFEAQEPPEKHAKTPKINDETHNDYPGPHKKNNARFIFATILGILLILFGIGFPAMIFVLSVGAYGVWSGIIISAVIGVYVLITGIFVLKGRRDENKRRVARILLLILGSMLLLWFILMLSL